jgi:hypothetical protein
VVVIFAMSQGLAEGSLDVNYSDFLIFWCIWRHRNDVVFNGARLEVSAVRGRIREGVPEMAAS